MTRQASPRPWSAIRSAVLLILPFAAPTAAQAALSCAVQTQAVSFGAYREGDLAPKETSGSVDVKCGCSGLDCLAFTYSIEIGGGSSGQVSDRRLRRAGETSGGLRYQLYRDVTRLLPFGTGSDKASALYLLTLFGSWQSTPVFGRIPAGQAVASGTYDDSPSVLITY